MTLWWHWLTLNIWTACLSTVNLAVYKKDYRYFRSLFRSRRPQSFDMLCCQRQLPRELDDTDATWAVGGLQRGRMGSYSPILPLLPCWVIGCGNISARVMLNSLWKRVSACVVPDVHVPDVLSDMMTVLSVISWVINQFDFVNQSVNLLMSEKGEQETQTTHTWLDCK